MNAHRGDQGNILSRHLIPNKKFPLFVGVSTEPDSPKASPETGALAVEASKRRARLLGQLQNCFDHVADLMEAVLKNPENLNVRPVSLPETQTKAQEHFQKVAQSVLKAKTEGPAKDPHLEHGQRVLEEMNWASTTAPVLFKVEDRHIRELNKNDAVKEQVLPAIKVACYEDEQFYELSKVLFKDTLKLIGDAKFQGHQSMTKDFAEVRRIILEIAREFETAARDGRIQKEAIDKGWKSWIYCNILKMFYLLAASGYLCAALMNGTLITLDSRQRHSFVEMFERLACEGHDLLGRMIIQLMQKEHQSVAMWLRHRLSASLPTRMILLVMSGTLEVIKQNPFLIFVLPHWVRDLGKALKTYVDVFETKRLNEIRQGQLAVEIDKLKIEEAKAAELKRKNDLEEVANRIRSTESEARKVAAEAAILVAEEARRQNDLLQQKMLHDQQAFTGQHPGRLTPSEGQPLGLDLVAKNMHRRASGTQANTPNVPGQGHVGHGGLPHY